jgi:hypothetical protein
VTESDLLPASGDRLAGNGHLLDDFDVESLERRHVGGGVREQADFVDAQIGEDLAAKAYLAKDALVLVVFGGPGFAMEENPMRLDGAVNVESAAGVVQVDERAASSLGDEAEGLLDEVVAVAG